MTAQVGSTRHAVAPVFDPASSTYTYRIASAPGREVVLIDPVKEQVAQYMVAIEQLHLRLVKAIDTHTHADHVTGLGELRAHGLRDVDGGVHEGRLRVGTLARW